MVKEQNRIVSEAKEDTEKRRRGEAKGTRKKKKIETTRKLTQVALKTRRKKRRRRRNLADQLVDLRTSISSLARRRDRKSQRL
jgi:hypothetical protein